nr:sugar ABC transporter substrate-binding protein [uncultured Agathobaculum sp.]
MKRNNLIRRSAAMLLAGLLAVSVSACGGGNSGAADNSGTSRADSSNGGTHKLSVVLKTTSSEYWSYVIAGIEQAEKDLGNVEVDVRGANSDTDFDGQLNMVETIVNADMCEAIAIAPLQADQIANALTGVKIPVLAIDTNFEQAETFIGTAHEDAAYQGGKYVAEQIGKGGKVVVLANIQGESTSEARVAGYRKALEEGGCEIISTQYTDGVGDKAVTVTDGVLQSFPDIDAIVCCADDVALGASRAIRQTGRDGDGIIVCGFDGISSGVQAVVDGEISCTVAQDPYNMGYQCVKSLLDVVEGEKLDDFIDTGCNVITPDNADEYLAKLKSLV